jgi:hypothetical protein
MFVESNVFPGMRIRRTKARMALSVLRLLYGLLQGDGEVDDEMTKVWSLPSPRVPKWETERRSEL